MKASDLSDIALVRLFTEARERMDLPSALRHVIARALGVESPPEAIGLVAEAVAARYGVDLHDLFAFRDKGSFWSARALAWWVSHMEFGATFKAIAKVYGGRNHSTVVKVLNNFEGRFVEDVTLQAEVAEVAAAVRAQLGQVRAA